MAARLAPAAWIHARGALSLERPRVMGAVNLTPDSFFDGGKLMAIEGDTPNVSVAVRRCEQLIGHGADVLDLGAESTRPGAVPVTPEREIARLEPVLARLCASDEQRVVPISVDTRHATVARRALRAGAAIINDVSGLADREMATVAAETAAGLVLGHLRGEPETMQHHVRFDDLLEEVTDELAATVERALAAGVERSHIVVDPGIGFGKNAEQSAALVAAAGRIRQVTGCPVLIGASRKSFLGAITGRKVEERLIASLAAALVAVERGASLLRVHDVRETVEALTVARAIDQAFAVHSQRLEVDSAARGGA